MAAAIPAASPSRPAAEAATTDTLGQSSDLPVGGRISRFLHAWQQYTSDPFVLSVVACGYGLTFSDLGPPPLSTTPVEFPGDRSSAGRARLLEAVGKLLEKGAIETVDDPSTPGFYSRLFLVPKKDGGWRPVIDLKALNQHLLKESFKMETPASIAAAMRPGEWTTSIDLKDAYFHVPMALSSRKFLRFVVEGTTYQFRALPFGLSPAPMVFTRVMGIVTSYAHRRAIRLHLYLDDWLIRALLRSLLVQHTSEILDLCLELGIVVNFPKSNLNPSQDFEFLGTEFRTVPFLCLPSRDRFDRLQSILNLFVHSDSLPARRWMSLIGTLKSLDFQVPLGRLYRRRVQMEFLASWDRKSRFQRIPVSQDLKQSLSWWRTEDNVMLGQTLYPFKEQVVIFTDASLHGWGAHLGSESASGIWPSAFRSSHINYLELEAIRLALVRFQHLVCGRHVLVKSDNKTAIAYINKQGGTHSPALLGLTQVILLWCRDRGIRLRCAYIEGALNVRADKLSRRHQVTSTEWSLHPHVVEAMWSRWGTPQVDLFATRDNFKLPTFVSPMQDHLAWQTDALSISWCNLWAYAYPPTPLIPRVLRKVREEGAELILVAPWWPKRPWSVELLELALEPPRALPNWPTLLRQPGSAVFHQSPAVLHLHAWRVSRRALSLPDFQRKWRLESPEGDFAPLL